MSDGNDEQAAEQRQRQKTEDRYKPLKWPFLSCLWDDYRLAERVGSGADADIYRIVRAGDEHSFAIKVIRRVQRLTQNEVDILQSVRAGCTDNNLLCMEMHGFVPDIFPRYAGSPQQQQQQQQQQKGYVPAIINEYVRGYDLFEVSKRYWQLKEKDASPPRFEIVRPILLDTLRALRYLHEHRMAHRDVKGENILYDARNNRTVLADLAYTCTTEEGCERQAFAGTLPYASAARLRRPLARRMLQMPAPNPNASNADLLRYRESVFARVDAMSQPSEFLEDYLYDLETLSDLSIMQRGDMWALGLTMYEFVTGDVPPPKRVFSAARASGLDTFGAAGVLERYNESFTLMRNAIVYPPDAEVNSLVRSMLVAIDSDRISAAEAYQRLDAAERPYPVTLQACI